MIFRFLLWVLAFLGFLWLWSFLRGERREPRRSEAAGRQMVRDRVCQMFLPESDAIKLVAGRETHFFCSEECRRRFLADPASPSAGGPSGPGASAGV